MKILLVLALTAAVAFAQPQLSIRGIAREGANGPVLAGVEVVLKEFRVVDGVVTGVPYRTAYTDARGEYEFKPERFGDFFLEATKTGYWAAEARAGFSDTDAAEASVTLSTEQPQARINFYLTQPGFLEGRVIDENGDALPNRALSIEAPNSPTAGFAVAATTDAEGSFRSAKLQPGDYIVRIGPQAGNLPMPLEKFTEEDVRKTDHELETSYWPGGVTDRAAALPIRVPSGATVNAGVIRPRNIDRYRVRLRLKNANCGAQLNLSVMPNRPGLTTRELILSGPLFPQMPIPCAEELLATGLAPGPYRLSLINRDIRSNDVPVLWAEADAVIGADTEPITLELIPAANIPVKLFAYEGALPANFTGRVGGQPIENLAALVRNVTGREYRVNVQLDPPYYVHSMRYASQPVIGNTVHIAPGAELEVVIDNRGGTLNGTVAGAANQTFVMLLPPGAISADIGERLTRVSPDGSFSLPAIPPGEYLVLAVTTPISIVNDPDAFTRTIGTAERVTFQRGETRTLNLRLR